MAKTMRNGSGCGCGCVKSLIHSNINNSNHDDPFKSVNYNNNQKKKEVLPKSPLKNQKDTKKLKKKVYSKLI
tara:strand:- start:708 stop:923 length:216 start_codon:yes stop_codon:yes gene_type:complete